MTNNKWVMNRAGLLNFWYYDEEIFNFNDGKLLLRGSNGSGKSVTMQSFLPVLLDGKKSPDRLDPFGSKARRMEDYLLGEKEVVNRDERTGYLFLEYKKQGTNQYMTTGIGMQAKRQKSIKSWYFLITDNRRIGIDFQLAQKHGSEKVPFSAKELENRISSGGFLVHTQREYMELVNKYIFGFQSIEAYEDLIKLLIQLRSPKLSKDFKPTVIYEILESALPPLTDDELRHLSDTIENMDQAQQQLDQLQREYESVQRLKIVYDNYNKSILAERAKQWKRAEDRRNEASETVRSFTIQLEEYEKDIKRLIEDKAKYQQERLVAENEQESLRHHEVWSLERNKGEKEEQALLLEQEIKELESKWDERNKKLNLLWKEKEQKELEHDKHSQKAEELLKELQIDAGEAAFRLHDVNVDDYKRSEKDEFDFTIWLKEAKEHQSLLGSLEKLAEKVERIEEDYSRLQRESSDKKSQVDLHQKELDHLEAWFDEQHQNLETNVFQWIEDHPKLAYSPELRQDISRSLQGLYERNWFEQVRDKLLSAIHDYEARIKSEIAVTQGLKKQKENEIKDTKAELESIKAQKMLEPERSVGTQSSRNTLKEAGQPILPFYAAVEFKEHVTEEQRERLESALKITGVLDSLITAKPITPNEDAVIVPNPQILGYTLADYLLPDLEDDSPISKELVDEVLRSIPLEGEGTDFHLDVNGTYSIGCLIGDAPKEGPAKFIGRTSRKRHQREQIQLWTKKLELLQLELLEIEENLNQLQRETDDIQQWKNDLPHDLDLLELHNQIIEKKQALAREQEMLRRIDEDWKKAYFQMNTVKGELRDRGKSLNLSLTLEVLHQALYSVGSYIDYLHEFEKVALKLSLLKSELQSLHQRLHENEEELDELKGQQNSKSSKLNQVHAEIQSMERQLKLKGIDEIRIQIQEVQSKLKEATKRVDDIKEQLPKKEAEQSICIEKLEEAKQDQAFWGNMYATWAQMVEKEKAYQFFTVEGQDASTIWGEFESYLLKYERPKILEQLTKAYFNEQMHLTEYRMLEFTEDTDEPAWFNDKWANHYDPYINEWYQLKGRRLIQMEYRGQRVSPYYVLSALEQELEEQKGWLDEQDRQLYEDIIVHSVGTILRSRIHRAQNWVKEMDKIMADRDNSSGLIFSIAWKPLTAESEEELDTKDLVQLLQRNSKFLSGEDLERITKHFRSRIAKAKELIQLRNEGSTLHQVLKEVLDYRKWFTFVLSFHRTNEPKRELTNNAFFKFSGGEKAMAMYIPLFTAAYSRYKEAGEMAPYIISLDEAFAGVDENNIRDMFEVVEQLGFNYIMNSQALWGDYDTVSSLSIAELVRPKNADYVTVISYEWDGHHKSLVIEAEEPLEQVKELSANES